MKQLSIFNQKEDVLWQLYIDGASRNNPGLAGAGIYLLKNNEPILKKGFFLGVRTNNQAEYMALLLGLLFAQEYVPKNERLEIKSDSELLVKQILGIYTVKDVNLKKLFNHAKELLSNFEYSVVHILRESNKVADQLANIGIDKKVSIPEKFLSVWQSYEKSI